MLSHHFKYVFLLFWNERNREQKGVPEKHGESCYKTVENIHELHEKSVPNLRESRARFPGKRGLKNLSDENKKT